MNHRISKLAAATLVLSIAGCGKSAVPEGAAAGSSQQQAPQHEQAARRQRVVTLTPAALERVRLIQRDAGKEYLRVQVISGGSTGFRYDMQLDDTLDRDNDYFDETDGVKIIVDKKSALYLMGATVDWQTTPDGQQGFKFDNPNAVK